MLLELLLPDRCASCGSAGSPFCSRCRGRIVQLVPPLCARCGCPVAFPVERCRECAGRRLAFARARAAVAYAGPTVALVSAWKEHGRRSLGAVAAGIVAELLGRPDVDLLAAVPAVHERQLWRGQNPAATLAGALGERWEIPVEVLLERPRGSPRQRGLGLAARRSNVARAFVATRRTAGRICLVDDVFTTGATVGAAARELCRSGACSVEVVTFARALRDGARRG
ncbi:MAG: double zinc ribbon domain-containing protein [Gaiellales bacterium]